MTTPLDRLEISPQALEDIDQIVAFIEQRNPAAAEAYLSRLAEAFDMLASYEPRVDGPAVRFDDGEVSRRWPVLPAHPTATLTLTQRWVERVH